jgi:glyoxylase-like metal-dependent hydrolase (beta-lactamase superfamily II)
MMDVETIRPGLWRWTAPHPDWTEKDGGPGGWARDVASFYYEAPGHVVLLDPQVPPDGAPDGTPDAERFWRALDRDVQRLQLPVAVLLTQGWHERSASAVYERYRTRPGASVWVPRASRNEVEGTATDTFVPGDPLPGGVQAFGPRGPETGEVLYYIPQHAALMSGDHLVAEGDGRLRLGWIDDEAWKQERLLPTLRALLDLPLEMVLLAHGRSILSGGKEALAQAIQEPAWGDLTLKP